MTVNSTLNQAIDYLCTVQGNCSALWFDADTNTVERVTKNNGNMRVLWPYRHFMAARQP